MKQLMGMVSTKDKTPREAAEALMAQVKKRRIVGFPAGTHVKINDKTYLNGRTGWVTAHNDDEVGVYLGTTKPEDKRTASAWFTVDQLVKL